MHLLKQFPTGVLLLEPEVFRDDRGHFFESFNGANFEQFVPNVSFVQDNQSRSRQHVLRGLHYQVRRPQGKLVRVLHGDIFDVAVDLRRTSPWFGRWTGVRLLGEEAHSIWIPPGFAHGFLVLSEFADVHYKATDYYAPGYERTILWNDPELAIEWPAGVNPILSSKDRRGARFRDADVYTWLSPPLATLSEVCHLI